jgi:hypothetical protein
MRMFLYGLVAIGLGLAVTARAEVYRCENPDLGVVFQQTPCAEPEPGSESDDAGPASDPEGHAAADEDERAVVRRGEDVADVVARKQAEERESAEIRPSSGSTTWRDSRR